MPQQLLIVYPTVVRRISGEIELEFDFCENLRVYLENFDRVVVACRLTTETTDSGLRRCLRLADLPWKDRVKIIPLPTAYRFAAFMRRYRDIKRTLSLEIQGSDYLLFCPYGLIGSWPMVATLEAIRLKRSYAIEADVVYDKVALVGWTRTPFWKRLIRKRFELPLFRLLHRYCLRHASVALLHGQSVYETYSPFSRNAHKVYHMPVSEDDYIPEQRLVDKLSALRNKRPLKLCYVGRAIEMKGPMEWLQVLHELLLKGTRFDATWLGDGSLLPEMRVQAEKLKLTTDVKLPGFVASREEVLRAMRESDIFLFCHKTPESPRCLVEALASGCPLIGYGSAYPEDIVSRQGGGRFVEVGDWKGLAGIVAELDSDREALCDVVRSASISGRLFDRDTTMQNRIDLIKKYSRPNDRRENAQGRPALNRRVTR